MRTTVTIDDDILDAARAIADAEAISLGQALSRLARRGLRRVSVGRGDRPVFAVRDDAPPITPAMVERALHEE